MALIPVEATFDNLGDLWSVKNGLIPADRVRRVVTDALVDEDEALTWMPTHLIERLGLHFSSSRPDRGRPEEVKFFGTIRLMIQGRDFTIEVAEPENGEPARIGRVALLGLDLVIDHESQTLVGNPAHGGEWMYESYGYSTTESTA